MGDEIFPDGVDENNPNITAGFVHFVDFSDLENPKEVARYELPGQGSHNYWIEDDVLYIKLNTSNIKKNMNLKVDTNYDFKYNGVQIRIEDIKNEIEYFKKDTSSHVKTLINNRQIELSKLEDRIKFNMTSTRVFTRGNFSYTIKVIDVRSDSVAIAKLIKLNNPYVTMRASDKVKLRID